MIKIAILSLIAVTALSRCPNDEFCTMCNENNNCSLCVNAFSDDEGICQQGDGENVENCYTFADRTTCASCNKGYYVSNGRCREITVDKCAMVDSEDSTKCIVCNNGKLPADGKCQDGDDCNLSNCKHCRTAEVCAVCDDKYAVNENGKCISDPIDNCQSALSGTCIACSRGYYMSSSECKKTGVQGSSIILSAFVSLMVAMKLFA